MTFADLRTKFIEISGRGDFEDTSGDRSEFFIKAGYDYLSSLVPVSNMYRYETISNQAGKDALSAPMARAVKSVYWFDGTSYIKLTKLTSDEFVALYQANQEESTPAHWVPSFTNSPNGGAVVQIGAKPIGAQPFRLTILSYDRFNTGTDWAESGETWLSINYPDLIIQSALYKLEVFYRNMEGAKGWNEGIKEAVKHIDFDIVDQELAEVNTMTEQYKLDRRL